MASKETPAKLNPEIKDRVNQKLLNFISYKLRSEQEITQRLNSYLSRYKSLSKKDKDELMAELLENLRRNRLLDDAYFSQSFVLQKINSPKPASRQQMKKFLYNKGIPKDLIDEALKLYSSQQEEVKLDQEARKKLSFLRGLQPLQKKKKLYDYLARKGYSYNKIRTAVDRVMTEE